MREKILLIDDDELLLRSLVMLLWKENYAVTSVNDGKSAIEKIEKEDFDLIVLDIRMPGLGGIEILTKIKELQKDREENYVIIMTGYASEDVPIRAIKLGVIDYIMKPFETSDFLYGINRGMKMVRLKKEKSSYMKKLESANQKLMEANKELKELQE